MHTRKIAVVGLGYVGLPVAVAFATHSTVIGFDKNPTRIQELKTGFDRNHECTQAELRHPHLHFTQEAQDLSLADFYIVAVPTPINPDKTPDLSLIYKASETVGQFLKKGDIVVYESTVYPGVTEEECLPILEKASGLKGGVDFKIAYSPERINPGDQEHTFTRIQKVVSAQDESSLEIVAAVYGSVVTAGVYRAKNIKTAEAAKVIENTQRDLNIAFMNELSLIFDKMGISIYDVLAAASTKWNFLSFKPGLVGGHCIGVDPYYLTHKAEKLGYCPEVILAGRRINDSMGQYIAEKTLLKLHTLNVELKQAKVAVLGMTFKEDCHDIRNSKVEDIVKTLQQHGIHPFVCDPLADPQETQHEYGITLCPFETLPPVDALIIAVAHQSYRQLTEADYSAKLKKPGLIVDLKNALKFESQSITIWRL